MREEGRGGGGGRRDVYACVRGEECVCERGGGGRREGDKGGCVCMCEGRGVCVRGEEGCVHVCVCVWQSYFRDHYFALHNNTLKLKNSKN